ncbi:hypothetical protein BpHYR1_027323 [Brachionus plicatilis]|uniref:Uncharacterized protein n=1 Tax=Brachionus plicatilis TaxID=10195 RepID=A0A3M7T5J0_BRAPC|nr:hypothetical protein BpHYR1_027323 [Brachionus plicatilis]
MTTVPLIINNIPSLLTFSGTNIEMKIEKKTTKFYQYCIFIIKNGKNGIKREKKSYFSKLSNKMKPNSTRSYKNSYITVCQENLEH